MSSRPTQQFVKGQTILMEGAPGDRTYKIISGDVIICKKNRDGHLVPIAKLGAGEIFGEMYLFDGNKTRSASAIAVSSEVNVEVYFQNELEEMLSKLSPHTKDIFDGLSNRLRRTSDKYIEMAPAKSMSQLPDGTLKPNNTFIRRSQ